MSSKNPKEVWSTVTRILTKQQTRIKQHPSDLNNHFTTLASKLTNKENAPSKLPDTSSMQENSNGFKIQHTNYYQINKIILGLKNDCSSGYDNIPVRFIKPVSDHLISPLLYIINNSIDKNFFPNSWNIARVCPMPRLDQPTSVKDFRPISVLEILSKVYERVILQQLCSFIEKESLCTTTQSGFRKGHSTATILLQIRDDIKRAMDKSEVTLAILIDYSKAFDTIDQNILLEKLLKFNFLPQAIEIIFSYISDRKLYVQVDDKSSEMSNIYFGVPQGSMLGPVLFNLYVADLSEILSSTSAQYADGTTIYDSCKNSEIKSCVQNLKKDLNNLSQWSTNKNLLFNEDKTKSILFLKSQLAQ